MDNLQEILDTIDESVPITESECMEFELDSFTNLYYDTIDGWYIEHIDIEEGEEFIIEIEIPFIGDKYLSKEEFEKYKEIKEVEFNEHINKS